MAAVRVTTWYLEMTERPLAVRSRPEGVVLQRLHRPGASSYRPLYDTVGGPWSWVDRRRLTDEALERIVADPKVEVFRLTMVDVLGFGRQKGHTEVYRGHELTVNMLRKVQLQIAVNEDFVEPTVNAIMEAARSGPEGRIGDGKIFILPLEDCVRIRTGERGPEAI